MALDLGIEYQTQAALRSAFDKAVSGSLAEKAYAALRSAILVGDMLPNTRITESELGDILPVSRTPLREALHRLEAERLIISSPGKGLLVRGISASEMIQIYEVLGMLESSAVERGVGNYSIEQLQEAQNHIDLARFYAERSKWSEMLEHSVAFHILLTGGAGNPFLVSLIMELRTKTHSFRRHQLHASGEWKRGVDQHQGILDAIKAQDSALARDLMASHLQGSIRVIKSLHLEG